MGLNQMGDWSVVPDNEEDTSASSDSAMSTSAPSQSDWSVVPKETATQQQPLQDESFGTSAKLAIPRIVEDLAHGGMSALKSIPGYYQSAKTEVPGVLSAFENDPKHAGGQALAGLTELGHNALNI